MSAYRLSLQIFESPTGGMIADWSNRVENLELRTNPHGFETMSGFVPLDIDDAFYLYEFLLGTHAVCSSMGEIAWEGRIEDVTLKSNGIQFQAFGYWRAFSDYPYTGFWSDTRYDSWRIGYGKSDVSQWTATRWELSNQDMLYFAPREGENFGDDTNFGVWVYEVAENDDQKIKEIEFSYDIDLPNNWAVDLIHYGEAWASAGSEWTYTSTGSASTGTTTVTMTNRWPIIVFRCYNSTGSPVTVSTDTGNTYARIHGLRLKGTDDATVTAKHVLDDLLTSTVLPSDSPINDSTILLNDPLKDLNQAVYIDRSAQDILNELVALGDDQDPPNIYDIGVYKDRILFFQSRALSGLDFYADIGDLDVQQTLDTVANQVYASYDRTDGKRSLRTDVAEDTFSQARYNATRQIAVKANTTDETEAEILRDTTLNNQAESIPRGSFSFAKVFDSTGAIVPNWMVRSGDTMTLRNLPSNSGDTIDRITRFRVIGTSYDVDADILTIQPEFNLGDFNFQTALGIPGFPGPTPGPSEPRKS